MRIYILLLFVLCSYFTQAQTITVPDNIYFANQQLRVTNSGQREIQRMVDALTKYPKYYQLKVDLADTYFPIIERIFREEGLPEDFKYLSLQESGLTSDAVSTSKAVGFWQFKKEAATDYGLRINQDVDERKHIIESSRSAARYLVKSNNLYYHNWHNTLLSYLLGFTGAKSYTRPEHQNSQEMEITDKTHPYILTFLAHKVAFENAVGKNESPLVMLQEIVAKPGATLDDIALETQVPATELQRYNKWLSGTYIPYDKPYTVLIPIVNPDQETILASRRNTATSPALAVSNTKKPTVARKGKREFRKVNGLKVIIARQGDTKDRLADEANLSSRRFMAFNDLESSDPIIPGEPYYLQRKKSKASVSYHVVKPGERLHQIAQKYGVKKRSIVWNNRLKHNETLATGRLLWMQRRRPSNVPVEFQKVYPESEPKQTPVNPGILAKNKAPEVVNTPPITASAQLPTEVQKPAKDYKTDKPVNTSARPNKVVELDTESVMEIIAAETSATGEDEAEITEVLSEKPIDVALTNTNAQNQKTTETLNQHIDKQIETINKTPAPVTYKKPAATQATSPNNPDIFTKPTETAVTDNVEVSQKPASNSWPQTAETASKTSIPAPTNDQHVVVKGETLYSISKMYNITIANLKSWNYLSDGMPLRIGDSLKVVPAAATELQLSSEQATASIDNSISDTHTVAAGESMYAISRKYGVTIKEIMEWNNKVDFSVRSGEKLIIKATTSQN